MQIKRIIRPFIGAFLFTLIGFAIGTSVFNSTATDTPVFEYIPPVVQEGQTIAEQVNIESNPYLSESERTLAELYETVSPSVVSIRVSRSNGGFSSGASGTGFVIDQSGHIVTNYHVVQNGTTVEVKFLDGTITLAEVVGLDPDADLAVIKVDIPTERLHPVAFGNMNELVVGQEVVALGSPFGQEWTLTKGIVSALNRTIDSLGDYSIGAAIQTDAPINPGNSGGPLLNLRGQVIGVNSQILSESGSNSGIGFAIPADLVQRVSAELIKTGEVSYSVLGIQGGDVGRSVMNELGLANNQQGVVISSVQSGSPAAAAGLLSAVINNNDQLASADIIVAIDGTPMTGISSLISYLARYTRPGDVVNLTVLRNGEEIVLPLTLGER